MLDMRGARRPQDQMLAYFGYRARPARTRPPSFAKTASSSPRQPKRIDRCKSDTSETPGLMSGTLPNSCRVAQLQ